VFSWAGTQTADYCTLILHVTHFCQTPEGQRSSPCEKLQITNAFAVFLELATSLSHLLVPPFPATPDSSSRSSTKATTASQQAARSAPSKPVVWRLLACYTALTLLTALSVSAAAIAAKSYAATSTPMPHTFSHQSSAQVAPECAASPHLGDYVEHLRLQLARRDMELTQKV
jgi:hypothetical protein